MFLSLLLQLAFTAILVSASTGDRSKLFTDCVTYCIQNDSDCKLTLALHVTRWTCLDDCRYQCMHSITDKAIEYGTLIHQYFGKWPFIRLLGMQEPASVLFSLFNLLAHVQGVSIVKNKIRDDHPMKPFYIGWAFVSINGWVWSSVFHTRDLSITEKLDYFSAALTILFSLYAAVIRFFHLYPSHHTSSTSLLKLWTWTLVCIIIYISHISYLSIPPSFDYSYNVIFNLILGLTHNFLWLTYSFPSTYSLLRRFPSRPKSYRPTYANKAALFVMLATAAMALELFDFAPWWRIIDAHSLWHLATAPITMFWYEFLLEDAHDEGWKVQKKIQP